MENSLLSRLAPELRNEIYRLVLTSDQPLTVYTWDIVFSRKRGAPMATQPALTKVCRQVREETLKMFYHANTFLIEVDGPTPRPDRVVLCRQREKVTSWLSALDPATRDAAQNLLLSIDMGDGTYEDVAEWRDLLSVLHDCGYYGRAGEKQMMKVTVSLYCSVMRRYYREGGRARAAGYMQTLENEVVASFAARGIEIETRWPVIDGH